MKKNNIKGKTLERLPLLLGRHQDGRPSAMSGDAESERTTFVSLLALTSLQKSAVMFGREESSMARTPRGFIQTRKLGRGFLANQSQWNRSSSHSRWTGES